MEDGDDVVPVQIGARRKVVRQPDGFQRPAGGHECGTGIEQSHVPPGAFVTVENGLDDGGDEGGAHAVAADVADGDGRATVGQAPDLEHVAADGLGGEPGRVRGLLRSEVFSLSTGPGQGLGDSRPLPAKATLAGRCKKLAGCVAK